MLIGKGGESFKTGKSEMDEGEAAAAENIRLRS